MKKTLLLILLLGTLAFLAAQTQFTPINPVSEDDEVEIVDDEIMLISAEDEDVVGRVGYLGVFVDDLNFPKAQALKYTKNHGVLVVKVVEDSPAAAAKLQADDIIMMMNEQVVQNKERFIEICDATEVGDKMMLKIRRGHRAKCGDHSL